MSGVQIGLCRLRGKDITIRVTHTERGDPFWSAVPPHPDDVDEGVFIYVTCVNDESLIVMASSPRALEEALFAILETFVDICAKYLSTITLDKGKTEALLKFRGKAADAKGQHFHISRHIEA